MQETRNRRLGVLATEATVRSNAYQGALHTLDAGVEVFAVPCPRLAPLIQEGDVFSEETEKAAREYVAPLNEAEVDTVITLCGEGECPLFLGKATHLHWPLPDPAAVEGDEPERLDAFRRTRDELRRRIEALFITLNNGGSPQ